MRWRMRGRARPRVEMVRGRRGGPRVGTLGYLPVRGGGGWRRPNASHCVELGQEAHPESHKWLLGLLLLLLLLLLLVLHRLLVGRWRKRNRSGIHSVVAIRWCGRRGERGCKRRWHR